MSDTNLIIERLETCFHMSFDAKESEKLCTPQEVTDYIWNTLGKPENTEKCISQILFYTIRKELADILDIDKKSITPQTCLKELGSKKELRSALELLEIRLQLSIPKMNRWLFGSWRDVFIRESIRKFTVKIIEVNSTALFDKHGLSKNDIYGMVRSIVIDVAGVSHERVHAKTRIVDELGIE